MKILITRTGINIVDLNTYNCQELGLAKALSKRGHKVYITTPDHREEHIQIPVEGGAPVEVYKLKLVKLNQIVCWHRNLKKVLDKINPDIIHLNGFRTTVCLYYTLWQKNKSCRIVMVEGNYDNTSKPVLKQLQILACKTMGRYILNQMDGYGSKTLWAGKYVQRFSNVAVDHTPIGLDVDKFTNYNTIDWREKLGIEGKKVLLYVGLQEQRRNPLFLLEIVNNLQNDYVLLMVGTGPMASEVKKRIEDLKLQERVFLLGKLPQSDLPSLYLTSDLFLLASSYEIYGMVLLESMYFGLPVISSLTAGSDCLIENGIDGMIIKDFDVDIWVANIQYLCENLSLLKEMKLAAIEKIKKYYVWDSAVISFEQLYLKTLN